MRSRALIGPVIGIGAAFLLWKILARLTTTDPAADTATRIGLACAALVPAVCALLLMVVAQMGLRVVTRAIDPLAGRDGRLLQVNQRALANTVEQLTAFAPALLAVAARAPAGWMPSVVSAGLVFGLARLVFWGGYLVGPLGRSPGMAATFAINVATLVTAVRIWWP
jgi:uncharacterized membrane protein YecN with MAPEG domain